MKLKMNFMRENTVLTEIWADYKEEKVQIKNHTDNNLDKAFGINEHPTFEDYEEFLEDRCIPRSRDRVKLALKEMKVPYYDPLLIVKKTKGVMAGDHYWIDIVEED